MGFNTVLPKSKYEIEIAMAMDETNTAYAITPYPGAFSLHGIGLNITIPPNTRPALISWDMGLKCTTAGTGIVQVGVAEVISGVVTPRANSGISGTFASAGVYPPFLGNIPGSYWIPPSNSWRYYYLYGNIFRDSGSLAVQQLASSDGGTTFLRAIQL